MQPLPFLIAPTEPAAIRQLGVTSPQPEAHGCDVLWADVGVQRKELGDLWASLRDGRLARAIAAMAATVAVRILVVEGRVRWSPSGRLATAAMPLDRDGLRGLLLSIQHAGVWVVHTDDVADTARALVHLRSWTAKPQHSSVLLRPAAPRGSPPGTRTWGIHLLQSFPGIGPTVAGSIVDHFGGLPPLAWTCERSDLAAVAGVGPVRADRLWTALHAATPEERGAA